MLDSLDTLIAFVLIMLVVSLLITIVVQMCAATLNLRGQNLLSALGGAFAAIAPSLEVEKHKLAGYLLKGGLLSDSFLPNSFLEKWKDNRIVGKLVAGLNHWRHSSAIRPGELFDAIHRIAIGKEPATENLRNNAQSLLIALGVNKDTLDAATKTTTEADETVKILTDKAKNALASVTDENVRQKIQAAVNGAVDAATNELRAAAAGAAALGVTAAGAIDAAYEKFHYWTCICEERAQQWLTMHTRILTVIFAFIFAFVLQLDTVEIFKLVSSNKTVRDKLVAQAGAVETQAARVLVDVNVLKEALKNWSAQETDAAVKAALSSVADSMAATDTRETVRAKVDDALKDKHPTSNFNAEVSAAAKKRVEDQSGELRAVKADLDNAGFTLTPAHGLLTRWDENGGWTFSHVLGILFSAGLLSLGAPFWYHSLKDLVSLRSQVAQNIAEQKDKPDAAAPTAPPTVKPPDDKQAKQAAAIAAARAKVSDLVSKTTDNQIKAGLAEINAALDIKPS